MSLSVVKRLNLGELTPTTMTLQMADKTMAQSEGILEDVLMKVGKFIFLVDFVVIDIEEDKQVPLLLGKLLRCVLHGIKMVKLNKSLKNGFKYFFFKLRVILTQNFL